MGIWYATLEQVKFAPEIAATAYSDFLIKQKLEAASRGVESLLHRRFYPELRTIKMDWPSQQYADTWQIYLDGENELISLTSFTSGGASIPTGSIFLRRSDNIDESPYDIIEIDLASAYALAGGVTFQRSQVIAGLTGYNATDTSIPHAILGANINNSVTTIVLNPTSGILNFGVGSIILIGTERMIVLDRRMSDTGQNLVTNMNSSQDDVIVDVADGTQFATGETILLGPERMRINDIAGNNLIVERAYDGSLLTAHTAPEDVFALRTCTVKRAVLGTTAASHNQNDNVYHHDFAQLVGLVNELTIAETVTMLQAQIGGYAASTGTGGNKSDAKAEGIDGIRQRALDAFGRDHARHGAI